MRPQASAQTMLAQRAWIVAMLLTYCLAVTITGCSSTTGRASAATPAATATSAPIPPVALPLKVVFQADWSHGYHVDYLSLNRIILKWHFLSRSLEA